jgi:hypothetical protein
MTSPIVLDFSHALRVLEARHRRKGHPITPALLRSWAAGHRANTYMPDYRLQWATALESRALSLEEAPQ